MCFVVIANFHSLTESQLKYEIYKYVHKPVMTITEYTMYM